MLNYHPSPSHDLQLETARRDHGITERMLRAQLEASETVRRENEVRLHRYIASKETVTTRSTEEHRCVRACGCSWSCS